MRYESYVTDAGLNAAVVKNSIKWKKESTHPYKHHWSPNPTSLFVKRIHTADVAWTPKNIPRQAPPNPILPTLCVCVCVCVCVWEREREGEREMMWLIVSTFRWKNVVKTSFSRIFWIIKKNNRRTQLLIWIAIVLWPHVHWESHGTTPYNQKKSRSNSFSLSLSL